MPLRADNIPRKPIPTLFLGFAMLMHSASAAPAEVANSVETGLKSLAEQISAKLIGTAKNTIAVLALPNADRSCSVLSTYLADKLTNNIFQLPNAPLKIIERSQLESIINKEAFGDILDPKVSQKLGSLSGVNALVIGTITQIGDNIDINARLVSTETGLTLSVASVEVPQTDTVKSLLKQPLGAGTTCNGVQVAKTPVEAAEPAAAPVGKSPTPPPSDAKHIVKEGISFQVQRVVRDPDNKGVAMMLSIINTNPGWVGAILVAPKPAFIDDQMNTGEIDEVNGIAFCGNSVYGESKRVYSMNDPTNCYLSPTDYTTLTPNTKVTVLLRLRSRAVISGTAASFSLRLLIRTDPIENATQIITLDMPDLTLGH